MPLLADIPVEDLRDALEDVTEKKPTKRLMLAILYKQGPSVPMIAEWFDVREDTIYFWFRAMEREPLLDAVHDESPPGRPPKLDDADREQLDVALRNPPSESGYDEPEWTTALVRRYLREEFGVEYSRRHVQRILNDAAVTDRGN